MSREIKFRAWDKKRKRYAKVIQTTNQGWKGYRDKTYITNGVMCFSKWVLSRFIIEQYTGLKDKNGKEIYEGDIVEQFVCGIHQFKGKKCGRSTIWQVRWNKKECCFELHYLNGSLFGDSMMSDGDEYEVIGTIHENPELLEGEK